MVRNSSRKFIGIFLLQGVCVLTIILLNYFFVYNCGTCKYSLLVFQLKLNVFPIFDILIPGAFIFYTHYVNFSED
jgi:hypothetical protein